MDKFTVSIIGMGLMGGSLAYALKGFRNCIRIGVDTDADVCAQAVSSGAVDVVFNEASDAIPQADLSIFCTYPGNIVKSLKVYAHLFREGSIVTEIAGVKSDIAFTASQELPPSVDYIGIHPMAGKEVSGFANADAAIFANTGFLIIPVGTTRKKTVDIMTELARHIGATSIAVTNALDHDRIIAYSSDLMHIAASALCMNYPDDLTRAYTAGAFRDCTRIANLVPQLWVELFMENGGNILPHLNKYIENLFAIRLAIESHDNDGLRALLTKAQKNKEELNAR